ncbi:MAG: hypothetical protein Terrestrivirus1_350 [Terrestrivirus sp.]|jgi:hypothetical protein|uniref:Uncharacterized protein n=1 Tax=Terrestrivirus sp. TaxID=2487775 RepID=A0A3G4ZKW9_9VIRU|nr:MAG: hypothetical protein Terrestrivirus1_350 [Terrestrivirus sp.]
MSARPTMMEMSSKKWIFVQSHDYKKTYLMPEDDFKNNFEIVPASSNTLIPFVRHRDDESHFEYEKYVLSGHESVIPIVHVMNTPSVISVVGVYVIDHPNVHVQSDLYAKQQAGYKWYFIQSPWNGHRRTYLVHQGLFEEYFKLVTSQQGKYQSTVRYKNGFNDFERIEADCVLSKNTHIPIPQLHDAPFSIVAVYHLE